MFAAPWICRKCIDTALKPGRRRLLRFASTKSNAQISPILLARARNMALEHDKLMEETAESFDAKIAKRIGELRSVTTALKEWDDTQESLSELNAMLADPTTDAELRELALEDLESTATQVEAVQQTLTVALTPRHPFQDMPCLIEIRPGAGGSEGMIFAEDLLRMYKQYCSRKGMRTSVLKHETTDVVGGEPGLLEAILEVESAGAYGHMRSEAGVHRVQRVPATETQGRTHTSAAAVLVLPSFPVSDSEGQTLNEADFNDPNSDFYVNPTEVRTDVMRASGAGGQHVNKTDSAVRLTHIPTNTVVSMQESRSQHQNRAAAWALLRSRIAQAKREAREEEIMNIRRGVIGVAKMGRGDKVRTYNYGQQRVTDHRSGINVYGLDDVMEGGEELDKVIDSVKIWLGEMEIQVMLAEEEAATNDTVGKKK